MPTKPDKSKPSRPSVGRPAYRPTIQDRTIVEQMKFCGEPHAVIARALRIDVKTLEKHFGEELENGHANRRREIIGLMFDAAAKGNVSAQKHLDGLGRVAGEAERIADRGRVPEPKVGKKEQQQAAAEAVSGKFAPPAPPKLVVSNT